MTGLDNPDRAVGGLSVRLPDGVELRPLSRDDFDDALAMISELYLLPAGDVGAQRERFDAQINSVDNVSFLAAADGEVAAIVVFSFRRRLNWATWEGWVSDLYVRPAARRRGIGRALMRACVEEWRLRQGHRLTLETGYENVAARSLYESLGMTDAGKMFQRRPVTAIHATRPSGLEIRPIGPTDFEAVTRLLAELGRPAPSDDALDALRRTYNDHLRRSDTGSTIAVLDGTPVAFLSLEFRRPFAMPAEQAWIPDLIVAEGARGRGVGAALLDAAFGSCEARGAYGVVLESGHHRLAAHRLYARCGMMDVGSFYVLDRPAGD
ncbi:MAG: GNAT family N-acetyltransferase [Candidatus Limnocylindria bacterium]